MSNDNPQATPAADAMAKGAGKERSPLRTMRGIVVSDKMDKTIVILVNRKVRHPIYEKFVSKRTKLHAHDENDDTATTRTATTATTTTLTMTTTTMAGWRWRPAEWSRRAPETSF